MLAKQKWFGKKNKIMIEKIIVSPNLDLGTRA